MKKLTLLLIVCMLAWGTLAGCQRQQVPTSQESISSTVQTGSDVPENSQVSNGSDAAEGEPVVICIEDTFEQDAYELENYLLATGLETDYEFLVLPSNSEDREPELTRLRTEIMAGEGPDAFVISTYIPGYSVGQDPLDSLEPLFPNVEKSMYSHLFLDVEEMVQQSEIVDLDSCNQTVMDVGVTEDGRFLLPLTYTFPTAVVDKSALEDPDYTFSTMDELLQSDQETLKGLLSYRTLWMFPNCLGVLADYDSQKLLVTPESLQKAVEQAGDLVTLQDKKYSGSSAILNGDTSWTAWMDLRYDQPEYSVFPIPNQDGGVTAAVTMFAAVNRNAEHPQEAFALIEQLFREELTTGAGFEVNGRHYCSVFDYGDNYLFSLPVKEQLVLEYIESSTQASTMASLRASVDRIDSAKVYSDLDQDIYEMYYTWCLERPDETLEELVEQTISSMEMTLAE